jgi:hypothetical protein
MTMTVPLTTADYDRVLLYSLQAAGLSRDDAARLIAARWPLIGPMGVMTELYSRGWSCDVDDLRAYIGEFYPELELSFDRLCWTPAIIDHCARWLRLMERGCLTPLGEQMVVRPDVVQTVMWSADPGAN